MKLKTRDGPILFALLVLLGLIVSACGTATPSPGDVAVQQTVQAVQVCGTAVALNMANPCAPTSTPTPIPTATPIPSPTPMPFNGWKQFTEQGEWVRDMPPGFVPSCEGAGEVMGCPGWMYIEYINGVPVNGSMTGTPGYWPYVLFGVPLIVLVFVFLYYYAYQSTAQDRAAAKVMLAMGAAFTGQQLKSLQAPKAEGENTSLARRVPRERVRDQALTRKQLAEYLDAYAQEHPVPEAFVKEVSGELNQLPETQLIPILAIQRLLKRCDSHHGTGITVLFGQFLIRKYQEERIE